MTSQEQQPKLVLRDRCLAVFVDDTGHEALVREQPVYGLGGCAALGRDIERLIHQPWKELRRRVSAPSRGSSGLRTRGAAAGLSKKDSWIGVPDGKSDLEELPKDCGLLDGCGSMKDSRCWCGGRGFCGYDARKGRGWPRRRV